METLSQKSQIIILDSYLQNKKHGRTLSPVLTKPDSHQYQNPGRLRHLTVKLNARKNWDKTIKLYSLKNSLTHGVISCLRNQIQEVPWQAQLRLQPRSQNRFYQIQYPKKMILIKYMHFRSEHSLQRKTRSFLKKN